MPGSQNLGTDWKKCREYLHLAFGFVDPKDSTETAFIFLKFSELLDVVLSKCGNDS